MLSPDILRLILGYLDFESKQKRAVLVCKQWFEIIRDNSALSGHLVLWPPNGNVTADEINEILKGKLLFTIYVIESFQDFLIKLDMKPCMHLVEISIFSLNLVIVRLTKIMNRADTILGNGKGSILKIKSFKNIF